MFISFLIEKKNRDNKIIETKQQQRLQRRQDLLEQDRIVVRLLLPNHGQYRYISLVMMCPERCLLLRFHERNQYLEGHDRIQHDDHQANEQELM